MTPAPRPSADRPSSPGMLGEIGGLLESIHNKADVTRAKALLGSALTVLKTADGQVQGPSDKVPAPDQVLAEIGQLITGLRDSNRGAVVESMVFLRNALAILKGAEQAPEQARAGLVRETRERVSVMPSSPA